jgi:hypothetical protein
MPTKLLRPNVGIYVASSDAFGGADITLATWAPTLAQVTDATKVFNVSPAITDDYTLNMLDSDVDTSTSMTDVAQVSTPTLFNYEASFDGFRDANTGATSVYNKFRDLFATAAPGTKYYLIKRIGKAHDAAFAVGDEISAYGVTIDYTHDIMGDGQMLRYAARFLPTGEVAVNVPVGAGTAGAGPSLATTIGTKIQSNGNVDVWWVPNTVATSDTFASNPTKTLLDNASCVRLTNAIAWDGFELGAGDSNKISDKGIVDKSNAQVRGFVQYSGKITFFRGITAEATGDYYNAYTAFKGVTDSRVGGFLVTRVGKPASATTTATTDVVNVYKFIADAVSDNTVGEDSVKFSVSFMPQGVIGLNKTLAA